MKIDLHNHTTFCNHATGSMHEYIEKALSQGIEIYGFSCHAPMEYDKQFRMRFDELDSYFSNIESLQKQYLNQCEIRKGLEVDFLEGYLDERVLKADVDFLIGSVHFLEDWGFDNPEFIGEYAKRNIQQCWKDYLNAIQKMAHSRLFDIVGHFDLLKIFGNPPDSSLDEEIYNTLCAIKQANMALEINTAGLRKPIGEIYPSKKILQMAYSLQIPITIGSDAHAIEQVGYNYGQAIQLALEVGYTHALDFKQRKPQEIPL